MDKPNEGLGITGDVLIARSIDPKEEQRFTNRRTPYDTDILIVKHFNKDMTVTMLSEKLGITVKELLSRAKDLRKRPGFRYSIREPLDLEGILLTGSEIEAWRLRTLAPYQTRILKLLVQGFNNQAISKKVGTKLKSVEATVSTLYGQLATRYLEDYHERVALALLYSYIKNGRPLYGVEGRLNVEDLDDGLRESFA